MIKAKPKITRQAVRFFFRRLAGALARPFSPGYSTCGRCERPWTICKGHQTLYRPHNSMFPLCEDCWGELTPAQRLPYYKNLIGWWKTFGEETHNGQGWPELTAEVERAVLAGL